MSSTERSAEPVAIQDCKLDAPELGAQLERYRRCPHHATSVQHLPGKIVVQFIDELPAGLLGRTLDVDRHCWPFIQAEFGPSERRLTLTVENVDENPRLEPLFHALSMPMPPSPLRGSQRDEHAKDSIRPSDPRATDCCPPAVLASCCEPESKDACCGTTAAGPASSCGCQA